MTDSPAADDDLAWIRAARLVADDVPIEEAARLRAWLAASVDGRRALQEADAAWRAAAPLAATPPRAWDTEAAMQRFRATRAQDEALPVTRVPGLARGITRRWVPMAGIGAAAAAIFAIALLGPARSGTPAETGAATLVAVVNAPGAALRTERLPDGSSVTLAPGSSLQGARGFGAMHRELQLTGEGAFTVAPGTRPFRVRLQGTVVEDLSTAFLVRPEGDGALVVVTEGAVVVGTPRDTLRQGVAARVGADGAVHRLGADVTAREMAWTRGRLVFADEPLGDIARRLTRWSGRPLTVAPALAARRVTVTFEGEPLDEMARVLAATVGARTEAAGGGWRVLRATP